MTVISAELIAKDFRIHRAILWGGFSAGVLDIMAAMITHGLRGLTPMRLLQSIASGLLGAGSYDGGWAAAALGLVCHFVIAFSAATVFSLAARKLKFLSLHAILSGILYGIAVYAFMQLVVLPLSAFPHKIIFSPKNVTIAVLTHMFCVGLPISLANQRAGAA